MNNRRVEGLVANGLAAVPPWFAVMLGTACFHSQPVPPSNPAEFCSLILSGDLDKAESAARAALVNSGADQLSDATEPLAAWLRSQPCVAQVDVPTAVVETEPAIREITFQLRPGPDNLIRACVADLRLAGGASLGIHPAHHVTTNTDTRCTVLPAQ